MKLPGVGKALLFEQPTVNGVLSPFPMAINMRGLYKRAVIRTESFSRRVKGKLG